MKSEIQEGLSVKFPEFIAERVYMTPFTKDAGLPEKLERWQGVVNTMLDGIDLNETIYLTIDQSEVMRGNAHRRGGAHIDGIYTDMGWGTPPQWSVSDLVGGGIVLASDQIGCKAYLGDFSGDLGEGGDCSGIDLSGAVESILQPNKVYIGNVSMVHETIPANETYNRTFVRLILPESFSLN